jgi:hypothetical protein
LKLSPRFNKRCELEPSFKNMPVITDGQTFINGIGLAFTLLMCLLMLVLPRRYALVPVIILTCYMTMGQRLMVAGANFTMIRILTLAGWIRIILRGEMRRLKLNAIDWAMMVWMLCNVVMHTLLWQTGQEFINRLGHAYDAIGLYFLFRFLIRDLNEVARTVRILAVLIAPLAGLMLVEKLTGKNAFGVFGGVMEFSRLRDGALRCQGPFAHPILAGTFGATLVPLFIGMWYTRRNRLLATAAIISCIVIVVTSASSGPALAAVAGVVASLSWYRRQWLRKLRWSAALGLVFLQMVMKAPVWFLMARVDIFGGSTGYHRAWLIDTAVKHFSEWWLFGIKNSGIWDPMLADVTNQYLVEGFDGGILTMLLFITVIVLCFRAVGIASRRSTGFEPRALRLCIWSLGASLFAHALGFLSISYFDQNEVNWYMLLAMISIATAPYLARRKSPGVTQTAASKLAEPPGVWDVEPVTGMSSHGI